MYARLSVSHTRRGGASKYVTLVAVEEWLGWLKIWCYSFPLLFTRSLKSFHINPFCCLHQKQECGDPSQVSRLKVWVKSHTKKDGTPVNMVAAEKFVSCSIFCFK